MLLKDWPVRDLLNSNLPKFLADEDVDARLVNFFSSKNVDIEYAPKGIKNSKLFELACNKKRFLLTFDKDFLNISLFSPSKLPGIAVFRVHPLEFSRLKTISLHFLESLSNEMMGKTLIITEEGIEIIG